MWPEVYCLACFGWLLYIMVTGLDMSSEWSIDILLFPAQLSVDLHTTDSCLHAHLENMKACIQSKTSFYPNMFYYVVTDVDMFVFNEPFYQNERVTDKTVLFLHCKVQFGHYVAV